MPNSFNSEYSNYYGANDELDDGDGTRDRSGVPFGPKAPAPPRSRQPLPSGKDVPDGDAPGRVEHERHDRQPEKSGRQRHLSVIGEPSGNTFRVPFSGKPNIQVQANGGTWSDQVEHNGTEQETWTDSDAESDPHKMTSRRSRAAREPVPDHSRKRDEDGRTVGTTGNRAVHLPQSTYYGGRGEGEQYAGRRYDNPDQVYRNTPSRPLGEMARYHNYYNRDPNPFTGPDEYTKQSYFGGPHRYAPPMGPYPGQALTYAQPMSYAQPSSYQPWQFPYNYGYPQPQPFPFSAPPPPPETPPPAPPVRNHAQSDKNDMDSVLKKVLRELEDNKKKLADKDDIIQKFKSKDRESEMLDKAKSTEARAEQMREQIKSELEAAAQKRLEDERQELAKREYQEKLNRAASEIRERLEQQLREEENRKKAEEQRILGLEADLRRRIEAEMADEQERRKREAEKRLYLEMEIREKINAERREQEEMTLREEVRKQQIEKRLEHEVEMKRQRTDELRQYKENIEARARLEANQIISAEKRKLDLEKLKLDIQHDTDRIIRDTMNAPPDETTASYHRASINVHDYRDPGQRKATVDGMRQNHAQPQTNARSACDSISRDTQSMSDEHSSHGYPLEMMTPQTANRSDSQYTVIGRPESGRRPLYNHSQNPFAPPRYGHVGSQQPLHQPTPLHQRAPFSILRGMAGPMPSPSGLSSNINIPNPQTSEVDHFSPELTESNLRSHIDSSLQAHVESEFEGGSAASFRQRASKSRMTPRTDRSSWARSQTDHLDPIPVHRTPTGPSLTNHLRAQGDSIIMMPRAYPSLSADTPLSLPDPEAVPAPTPPRMAGPSSTRTSSTGGSSSSRSTPSSSSGDHYHTPRAYRSPVVARSEPTRSDARSSRELALPESLRPVSGMSQDQHIPQLKRKKGFSK